MQSTEIPSSPVPVRRGTIARLTIALALLVPGAAAGAASGSAATSHPSMVSLTNDLVAHWAPVVSDFAARTEPSNGSPIVERVGTVTSDGTQNIVLILDRMTVGSKTWFDVRLSSLPNSMTGWVPNTALGTVYAVTTHLYVNRKTFTATLKRDGHVVFTTRVGVGKSYWPTPAGQFYIRDKLTNFGNPFYGPIAFGTSARSAVLTDWPGGGVVGVHGTNEPGILPGAVSHGCVRMVNSAIVRLAKLMPVGTPLTIT